MNKAQLKDRTKEFALRVLKLSDALPKTISGKAIASQIVRSGTSVAANYRAALRSRSRAEFIAKLGTVIEEADETLFWMELIVGAKMLSLSKTSSLLKEADELIAIFYATKTTSKTNGQ